MANTKFHALKAQAHETATARFNERLTKLNNMLTDARELMSKLENDPKAHEPILAEINDQFAESYTPFLVADNTIDDIKDQVRQVERARNLLVDNIDSSWVTADINMHNVMVNRKLAGFDWHIDNLEKPLNALKEGYEQGVIAYGQATYEFKVRYGF